MESSQSVFNLYLMMVNMINKSQETCKRAEVIYHVLAAIEDALDNKQSEYDITSIVYTWNTPS